MSLRIALVGICLAWGGVGGGLALASDLAPSAVSETVTYDVAGLVEGMPDRTAAAAELCDVIVRVIEPESWKEAGGQASIALTDKKGEYALRITQSKAAHRRIDRLLRDLVAAETRQPPALTAEEAAAERKREAILKALDSPFELNFSETPLTEMAAKLEREYKIPVILDREAIEDGGIDVGVRVSMASKGASLRAALNHALRGVDLAWKIEEDTLAITTRWADEKCLRTIVYDVADLTGAEEMATSHLDDMVYICQAIEESSWNGVGGQGAIAPFTLGPTRLLVVTQSDTMHEEIARIFADLRTMTKAAALGGEGKRRIAETPCSAAGVNLRKVLASPLKAKFDACPLRDVCQRVRELLKVPVLLDEQSMTQLGISSDVLVTFDEQGVSLGAALDCMLRPFDLTWTLRDECFLITTQEEANCVEEALAYDVSDLLACGKDGTMDDFDTIADLVVSNVAPTTWDCGSGPAPVDCYRSPWFGAIIVVQTPRVHMEIARFLADLRDCGATQAAEEERWRRLLGKPADFALTDVPLGDALKKIGKTCGIPVWLDRTAMEEAGADLSTPVTLEENCTAESALDQLLGAHGCAWVIKDGMVVATSREDAESCFLTAVYDVTRLLPKEGDKREAADYLRDELGEKLKAATGWPEWDGSGFDAFLLRDKCMLVSFQPFFARQATLKILATMPPVDASKAIRATKDKASGGQNMGGGFH